MGTRSFSVILTANLFGESSGILDSQVVTKLDFNKERVFRLRPLVKIVGAHVYGVYCKILFQFVI